VLRSDQRLSADAADGSGSGAVVTAAANKAEEGMGGKGKPWQKKERLCTACRLPEHTRKSCPHRISVSQMHQDAAARAEGASAAGAGLQLPRAIVHGLWRVYGM